MVIPVRLSVQTWLVQEIVFHAFAFAFELVDQYALLSTVKSRNAERRTYAQLLPRVLLNQTLVLLPAMMFTEYMGWCFTGESRLSPLHLLLAMPSMALGHDVVQYLAHRYLLHQPHIKLLRFLRHGLHHSTGATQAITACYMSPPDFFLEVVLPYLLPMALIGGGGSDKRFHMLIACVGAIGGLYEHSGYDFSACLPAVVSSSRGLAVKEGILGPVLSRIVLLLANFLDNRAHSQHHTRANVSFSDGFGSPGICDWLLKTRWDLVPSRRAELEAEWQRQRGQDGTSE